MSARPKKILFICGSLNQTTQMHQIANELPEYRKVFSPYYLSLIHISEPTRPY